MAWWGWVLLALAAGGWYASAALALKHWRWLRDVFGVRTSSKRDVVILLAASPVLAGVIVALVPVIAVERLAGWIIEES